MVTVEQHNSYDEVPYPDLTYAQTHPDCLCMLGHLLGMKPAPVNQCRVLEIGTAGGANLLALAEVMPSSTFVGMDRSAVQIEEAQKAVQATGITNVRFQQMDIMDITPEFGQFDYIIAHGIFSWVPPAVQDKLLDICRHNLAPQGIAYVSYNTYPGWHRYEIIRNMMLFHTRNASNPVEKSAQAREWVRFMADALKNETGSAYAAIFKDYVDSRFTQTQEFDHAALLHDELEAINEPFYFHKFMERAEQHGLQYLTEAEFSTVMPNGLSEEVLDYLRDNAHTTVEMEQYMDYLRDRSFRRTLLCHKEVDVNRRLSIRPLQDFYIRSTAHSVKVDAEKAEQGIEIFEGHDGGHFTTNHPLTIAAFHYLLDSNPLSIQFRDLVRAAASSLNMTQITNEDANTLAGNLLQAFCYSISLIDFHSFAPTMTKTISDRPLSTAFARYQTRRQSTVANLLLGRVELDNFNRLVLAQLDGTNDRAAILDFLMRLVEERKIKPPLTDQQINESSTVIRQALADQLEMTLKQLAEVGLLVA